MIHRRPGGNPLSVDITIRRKLWRVVTMSWWRRAAWEMSAVRGSVHRALAGPGPERDVTVQALKAAGAALLAWALVGWWWDAPMALMAPWSAVVLVQSTVYRSLRAGLQQMILIGLGTLLAAGAASLTGNTTAAMAIALPVAVLIGTYARFGEQGVYASTTVLFVLAYGSYSSSDIWHRLLESLVGALIGIGVNALILPPVHLRDVRDCLHRLPRDSAELLRTMADDVERGYDRHSAERWYERAQRLIRLLDDLRNARTWTRESYRFNPGYRMRRSVPALPSSEWDALWQRIADRLMSITGKLVDTAGEDRRLAAPPDPVLVRLRQLLTAVAEVCEADEQALTEPGPHAASGRETAVQSAWDALADLKRRLHDHDTETATVIGGLVADLQLLLYDLAAPRPSEAAPTGYAQ